MNEMKFDKRLIEPFLKARNVVKMVTCKDAVIVTKKKMYWTNGYTMATIEDLNGDCLDIEHFSCPEPADFTLILPLANFIEKGIHYSYIEDLKVKDESINSISKRAYDKLINTVRYELKRTSDPFATPKNNLKTALKLIETFTKRDSDARITHYFRRSKDDQKDLAYEIYEITSNNLKMLIIQTPAILS